MDADAIVIGAGAAGLAAARSLAGRSLRVIVLEARDRTGGRAWTDSAARFGVSAELGAEFIHGPAPETRSLLRDAGTTSVDTGGESWEWSPGGELQPAGDFASANDIFESALAHDGDESVEEFLHRFDGDPSMRNTVMYARRFVEGFDAADPAVASVRGIADEWHSGVDSTSARPLGGYRPIFEQVRKACDILGVERRLSTTVRRISWRRGSVSVEATTRDGTLQTVTAKVAVVTLPVGVLRHTGDETAVLFDPGLPQAKHDALALIEMGLAVKVGLWFRSAFWEELHGGRYRDAGFFRCIGQPFTAYWTQVPLRSTLVNAWAGGPAATALRGLAQPDIIERAFTGFAQMFGEPALARREFEGGVMHDWGADPFARGAYSYVAVGGSGARTVLAEPLEHTLFFAGEATANNGQGGTVNGALETGERAAREAASALGFPA